MARTDLFEHALGQVETGVGEGDSLGAFVAFRAAEMMHGDIPFFVRRCQLLGLDPERVVDTADQIEVVEEALALCKRAVDLLEERLRVLKERPEANIPLEDYLFFFEEDGFVWA